MNLLEVLNVLWESIMVDFIQGLLESKDPVTGLWYTEVIVVINRLIKYTIIKLVWKEITIE